MTGARLVVVGAGPHGREVIDIARSMSAVGHDWYLLGVLDDDPDCAQPAPGVDRLGGVELLPTLDADFVIGIGDPSIREAIDQGAGESAQRAAKLVHPDTTIAKRAELSPGCVLWPGARISTDAVLGRHVHVNLNTTISHDCIIDDYTTLSPGVTVCGFVAIERGVSIGAGAVILPQVRISAGATVGAGAVVVDDVSAGVVVTGVPARPRMR